MNIMYRKGISALIINQQDEILLVNLTSFEHHYFAIPGGGLDEGETQEQALYREIKEELGIEKDKLRLIKKADEPIRFEFKTGPRVRNGIEYTGQERQFFALRFIGSAEDINLAEDEVRSYSWVPYDKLGEYLLFDGQLEETQSMIHNTCDEIVPTNRAA